MNTPNQSDNINRIVIRDQLEAILNEVRELDRLLKPYEKLINKISHTPFAEMSISDKVNVAKLLIT